MDYPRTETDHVVFVHVKDGTLSIIFLYVNDITVVRKDLEVIRQDKENSGSLVYMLRATASPAGLSRRRKQTPERT